MTTTLHDIDTDNPHTDKAMLCSFTLLYSTLACCHSRSGMRSSGPFVQSLIDYREVEAGNGWMDGHSGVSGDERSAVLMERDGEC